MTETPLGGMLDGVEALEKEWRAAIRGLRAGLEEVFAALRAHAGRPAAELDRRPADGGWTPREVLEHVVLTDRFLLVLVDKIAARSRKRVERGDPFPAHAPRFEPLRHLASRERAWDAPGHMVPEGGVPAAELDARLAADAARCARHLDALPHGEGTLHRIRMSAVGGEDDRLDLYQYLEVVRLHATPHSAQIARAGP